MSSPRDKSLHEYVQEIPDEEAARLFFEEKRWFGNPICGHCGSSSVAKCKDHKPMPYRCRDCRKHFSVRTGTVLAESRLPLHKWLMAVYVMTAARKRISSRQMARELGVTEKTAWFLARRIWESWLCHSDEGGGMGPHIQVDRGDTPGRQTNKHASKKVRAGRGTVGKQVVMGIWNNHGKDVAAPIPKTKAATLKDFIRQRVAQDSTVFIDQQRSFVSLICSAQLSVEHSVEEYVRNSANINRIESFWKLLKRCYSRILNYKSGNHLHGYANEFFFRHSTSSLHTLDFIGQTAGRIGGRRLAYEELTHG